MAIYYGPSRSVWVLGVVRLEQQLAAVMQYFGPTTTTAAFFTEGARFHINYYITTVNSKAG